MDLECLVNPLVRTMQLVWVNRISKIFSLLKPRQFRASCERCSVCEVGINVQLGKEDIAIRCIWCGASAISQSLMAAVKSLPIELSQLDAYELSALGPSVNFLRRNAKSVTTGEYFENVATGTRKGGILCENVEYLTFDDASFDLCTSTEVFEHVEFDRRGYSELFRVLRPGGFLVLTVPLSGDSETVERTAISDGKRIDLHPPEYHSDRFRGARVFCYRNYGDDILDRLFGGILSRVLFHACQEHVRIRQARSCRSKSRLIKHSSTSKTNVLIGPGRATFEQAALNTRC